mmetsp:Transcript_7294/g.11647  ORF Transcript_7294/g.11647 Transcript_7294/m.11647 type:complete len:274 (-) Transcript_7294:706-1527(-)
MMESNMTQQLYESIDKADRSLFNPLGLSAYAWAVVILLKSIGVVLLDPIVIGLCKLFNVSKMPSRVPTPIMKGLEQLIAKDFMFLLVNQVIEGIGMMYFVSFAVLHPQVLRNFEDMNLGNVVGFSYLVFIVDDFFYYWAHRAMHLPLLYPLCHKHHHRQSMPRRGYFDAANEHPLEQIIGIGLVFISFYVTLQLSPWGVHGGGVVLFVLLYAIGAFLNHTEYDIGLGWIGLGYAVRAHEMHHRFPQCNYAQNTMVWDKLLGTFAEYRTGRKFQ